MGYAPVVTRSAMLVLAAFSLLGVFRLAERVANTQVAIASTLCTALYPVFFAQSSLAQVDLAAAGLIFWGLCAYLEDRRVAVAIWFSLAALAKETAILAPAGLGLLGSCAFRCAAAVERTTGRKCGDSRLRRLVKLRQPSRRSDSLVRRILPFCSCYCPWRCGTPITTPAPDTSSAIRSFSATTSLPRSTRCDSCWRWVLRLWQAFGYMHLWLLTLGMLLAMMLACQ